MPQWRHDPAWPTPLIVSRCFSSFRSVTHILYTFCSLLTDKRTDRQTEFSSLDRVCIPCSAVKTVGESALDFFQEVGRRIARSTAELCSFSFLMRRLSVAKQRGNAICITGTAPSTSSSEMTLPYCSYPMTAAVFLIWHHFLVFFPSSLGFDIVKLTIEIFTDT